MSDTHISRNELRDRVIDVAIASFHQEGIKAVTMDAIAHRLTMSKRTLYQLFGDKEELLLACLKKKQQEDRKRWEQTARTAGNVLEFILKEFSANMQNCAHISPAFFSEIKKYPQVIAYSRNSNKEQRKDAVRFLERGVEQGIFRPGIDFNIIYPVIMQQVDFVMNNPEFETYNMVDLFATTAMITIRGCPPLKGAAMMDEFMDKWRKEYEENQPEKH